MFSASFNERCKGGVFLLSCKLTRGIWRISESGQRNKVHFPFAVIPTANDCCYRRQPINDNNSSSICHSLSLGLHFAPTARMATLCLLLPTSDPDGTIKLPVSSI